MHTFSQMTFVSFVFVGMINNNVQAIAPTTNSASNMIMTVTNSTDPAKRISNPLDSGDSTVTIIIGVLIIMLFICGVCLCLTIGFYSRKIDRIMKNQAKTRARNKRKSILNDQLKQNLLSDACDTNYKYNNKQNIITASSNSHSNSNSNLNSNYNGGDINGNINYQSKSNTPTITGITGITGVTGTIPMTANISVNNYRFSNNVNINNNNNNNNNHSFPNTFEQKAKYTRVNTTTTQSFPTKRMIYNDINNTKVSRVGDNEYTTPVTVPKPGSSSPTPYYSNYSYPATENGNYNYNSNGEFEIDFIRSNNYNNNSKQISKNGNGNGIANIIVSHSTQDVNANGNGNNRTGIDQNKHRGRFATTNLIDETDSGTPDGSARRNKSTRYRNRYHTRYSDDNIKDGIINETIDYDEPFSVNSYSHLLFNNENETYSFGARMNSPGNINNINNINGDLIAVSPSNGPMVLSPPQTAMNVSTNGNVMMSHRSYSSNLAKEYNANVNVNVKKQNGNGNGNVNGNRNGSVIKTGKMYNKLRSPSVKARIMQSIEEIESKMEYIDITNTPQGTPECGNINIDNININYKDPDDHDDDKKSNDDNAYKDDDSKENNGGVSSSPKVSTILPLNINNISAIESPIDVDADVIDRTNTEITTAANVTVATTIADFISDVNSSFVTGNINNENNNTNVTNNNNNNNNSSSRHHRDTTMTPSLNSLFKPLSPSKNYFNSYNYVNRNSTMSQDNVNDHDHEDSHATSVSKVDLRMI